jgi:hypothetical protein
MVLRRLRFREFYIGEGVVELLTLMRIRSSAMDFLQAVMNEAGNALQLVASMRPGSHEERIGRRERMLHLGDVSEFYPIGCIWGTT